VDTYVEPGEVLEFTAPSGGVVSGAPVLIGSLLVVPAADVAQTLPFEGAMRGVFDLPKATDDAFAAGAKAYWDNSAKKLTTTAGGNTLVGVALPPIATAVVTLATDALAADLLISGLTLQVLDFAQLGTDDAEVTVTVNGVATVLVEGTDWTAAVSNNATATSLAAAIAALAGVKATATTDTVTVVPATGMTTTGLTTGRFRLDGAAR
jgi:predicted RecA/RadA family phage recombinase